jgi:hypothetical protein
MRTLECGDCGHTWQLPFGEGGRCEDLACPACESKNVRRAAHERGGRGRGQRMRRGGGWGAGRRWTDTASSTEKDQATATEG